MSSTGGLIVDVASQENGNKIIAAKNSAVTSSFLQCDSSGAWSLISVVEGGWEGRDHQGMSRPVTPRYNELGLSGAAWCCLVIKVRKIVFS